MTWRSRGRTHFLTGTRLSLLLFLTTLSLSSLELSPIPKVNNLQINVLLDEHQLIGNQLVGPLLPDFSISCQDKLILRINQTKHALKTKKLTIKIYNNKLYARAGKKPFRKINSNKLHIESENHIVTLNGKHYHGVISFILDKKANKLFLVNKLELEDYVYSVLLAECYQSWPHEMQKIQAIVSRTYGVYQMLQRKMLQRKMLQRKSKKQNLPYDIKCNTFHQQYKGTHGYHHLREAVIETKNLILTYNNDVIITMFDACCGGSVPALMKGLDFSLAPYLARTTPCNFCKNYSLYKWKRKIPVWRFLNEIYKNKKFSHQLSRHKKLTGIYVSEKDKAGVAQKITILQGNHKTIISSKDLWMCFANKIRSKNFLIKKENNNIVVNGRGFGHQIGLCQRGARELVNRDWSVRKILAFYYPNTTLARMIRLRSSSYDATGSLKVGRNNHAKL